MDKTFNFLGICKRAGALVTGEEAAGGAMRAGKAKLLITALDAGENGRDRAEKTAEACSVCAVRLPYDKDSLGELLGKRVCAVCAITDKNLALAFLEKLAAEREEYVLSLNELKDSLKTRRERRRENGGQAKV